MQLRLTHGTPAHQTTPDRRDEMKKSEKKKRYIIKYSPTFRQNLQDIFGFTEEQVREQEWETIKKQAKLREGLDVTANTKDTGGE